MGLFNGKKIVPAPARDPRPDGGQRGVTKRVHDRGPLVSPRVRTRTPWLFSGQADDGYDTDGPRWTEE